MYYSALKHGNKTIPTTRIAIFVAFTYIVGCAFIIYSTKYVNRDKGNTIPRLRPFLENISNSGALQNEGVEISNEDNASFMHVMETFPWTSFNSAIESQDTPEIQRLSTQLLLKLVPFLTQPPKNLVNESCVAPPIKMPSLTNETLKCKPLSSERSSRRKVGMLWQFGFDVDALEIHLHELDGLVDKFFILESIKAHSSLILKKPLIWERLKFDEKFSKFSDKVVHFLVDDSNLVQTGPENKMWSRELQQEFLRWTKFQEWNNATNYFSEDDLLGFGDVDEVPNRDVVAYLKNCEFETDSVDIGIWFPYGGSNTVFLTDFPVKGHPYTLGDPTFWTLRSANEYFYNSNQPPTRMRGRSSAYLLGGMHLSRYAYPPFQITKLLTASEADMSNLRKLVEVGMYYAQGESMNAESVLNSVPEIFWQNELIEDLEKFQAKNKTEAEVIVKIPWFLKCNPGRYPGFDKKFDSRLHA